MSKEQQAKRKCIEKLKSVTNDEDVEHNHKQADDALCEFLAALGYKDVVDFYHRVPKWFA